MPARAEGFWLPNHPFRWLLAPVLGWALLTTLVSRLRRRARQPSLPRMSDQWLLSHEREFSRLGY